MIGDWLLHWYSHWRMVQFEQQPFAVTSVHYCIILPSTNSIASLGTAHKSDIKKTRKMEAERLVKWNKMAQRPSIALLQHRKFRSRVEKGIPHQVRGVIWYKLCNIDATRKHLTEEAKAWLEPGFTLYTHYVREARRNPTRSTTERTQARMPVFSHTKPLFAWAGD